MRKLVFLNIFTILEISLDKCVFRPISSNKGRTSPKYNESNFHTTALSHSSTTTKTTRLCNPYHIEREIIISTVGNSAV